MAATSYGLRGAEVYDSYNGGDDNSLIMRMRETYNMTAAVNQAFWNSASIDERFYAGDQSLWTEVYSHIPAYNKVNFNFNKIKRIVNMVSGHQRKNRKSLNVVPIEGSDEVTADQFSKLLVWANNRNNTFNTVADAFLGALISGMNLLSVRMDYNDDPLSGDLVVDNLGYNGFIIDPYFTKIDFSDCNYLWVRKFLDKQRIAAAFPEYKEEIMQMRADSNKDGRFNFLPENYNFNYKNLLPYDEYWYLDSRPATILINKENGETLEYEGKKENLKYFLMMNPNLKTKTIRKNCFKMGIVVNGSKVLYHGKNPYHTDRLPFIPVTAYHRPELPSFEWKMQGMVRGMRDSQFISNRRQQILLDVLESQINSGLKVMEGSLVDNNDAFKTGQGQALFIKKDAPMGMESVQKIPPADVSPALFQIIQEMDKNMMEISGVNEELLGSAEDDKAGILSMLRQGAGLTTLQILFDRLDASMKSLGEIQIDMIQKNFTPGKVQRIINQEPSQEFSNKAFQKYDCTVVEGINTSTQRMMAFKQALHLKEVGLPISTKFLLEMSTFQNKPELIKDVMEQEKQQAEQMQMQMQMQMKELEARANLANARAAADYGLEKERNTRSISNLALSEERRMEAIKDLNQSELDKVKAIKELAGIDLDQIHRAMEILEKMKMMESASVEELSPLNTGAQL